MSEDERFDSYPHEGMQNMPLTYAIPYNFRWRIMNLKLMLQDLETLKTKYGIESADALIKVVKREVEDLCTSLTAAIVNKREVRKVWLE